MNDLRIDHRSVGDGQPVYLIAEISANHLNDFDLTARLIEAVCDAGADAIKVQTYTADTLTLDSHQPWFKINQGTIWDGQTLYDLYGFAAMPWEWQPRLQKIAGDRGVPLFSSPFDATAVDFLESMDVPAYKIASFEIVDTGLLECVAKTGKPVILSTGMASEDEIELAIATLLEFGTDQIALLECTSAYPAFPSSMNLMTMPAMRQRFDVPVGLSDHTYSEVSAITAVALGACIVEKHVTLDRSAGGPDSSFSLEPAEFESLIRSIREAEQVQGRVQFGPNENDRKNLAFRRSLFAVSDIAAGEPFTRDNVRSIRPSNGLAPKHLPQVLQSTAAVAIERGTPIAWELVKGSNAAE